MITVESIKQSMEEDIRYFKEKAERAGPDYGAKYREQAKVLQEVLDVYVNVDEVKRLVEQESEAYMADKLSYEEWKEKNKDTVLSDEAKEDLAKYHDDVKLQEALDFMLRQLYQEYLQSE